MLKDIMHLDTANQVSYDLFLQGLSEETVKKISQAQQEPQRMLDLRLQALKVFYQLEMPKF